METGRCLGVCEEVGGVSRSKKGIDCGASPPGQRCGCHDHDVPSRFPQAADASFWKHALLTLGVRADSGETASCALQKSRQMAH